MLQNQRTLVFCTAFAPRDHPYYSWEVRYRIWVEAVRRSPLKSAQLLLVDDGLVSLPNWSDSTILQEGDDLKCDAPIVLYHFKERLGRKAIADFPGWVRSFFFVSRFAEVNRVDKVVHLEADAFLISQAAHDFVDAVQDGWVAMWCTRFNRPESGIQVIAGSGLDTYRDWAARPIDYFKGAIVEKTLPFSHICRTLKGDRYGGDQGRYVPKDADWCMQAHPSLPLSYKDYFWWLDWFGNVFPQLGSNMMEPEVINRPSARLVHEGIGYLPWLKQAEQILQPSLYFEIGTHTGDSIKMIECDAVCVDPRFAISGNVLMRRRNTHFFQGTSDEFFADKAAVGRLFPSGIDLAFLDGLHHYEVLLRDFMRTEKIVNETGLVLIHDCLPLNTRMAERTQKVGDESEPAKFRNFWTGDVWKAIVILAKYRPDLLITYLDCGPTGLVACTGLKRDNTFLDGHYEDIVREFESLTLAEYGIKTVWELFPTYRSGQVVANKGAFRKVLYRRRLEL